MPPFRTVSGQIIESNRQADSTPPGQRQRDVMVRYVYEVEGVRYVGSRVHANPISQALDRANSARRVALLARYPQDAPVTVYYDVHAPSRAFLERSLSAGLQTSVFLVGILVAIIVLALVVSAQGSPALLF